MNLIVAVDENWGIGYKNTLLVSIKEDMKFFRETTKGKVVIMGRRTLESFPGGEPLKNRVNIVFTKNPRYEKEGTVAVHNLTELREAIKEYKEQEIFVIGGGSVYKMLLPLCDTAYVTKIHKEFPADTFFPNLDKDKDFRLVYKSEDKSDNDIRFNFTTYKRI